MSCKQGKEARRLFLGPVTIKYIERSKMKSISFSTERGQALILISLAAIGLFAIVGLAIDGSNKYSDRRHAQNAADSAVLAGALSKLRGDTDWQLDALDRALENGYDDNHVSNEVEVYPCTHADADCGPYDNNPKYVQVVITSHVDTFFARIIGITQTHNIVEAIAMADSGYTSPAFAGNAVVSLVESGNGFDAHGTPDWILTGGGIYVNSSSTSAATCGGNAGVTAPSVTVVGGTNFSCHTVSIGTTTQNTGSPIPYATYSAWFPRQPACNGTASKSGGQWQTQSGADGSRVSFSGDMDFAPGLYCVTNSPGPFHGQITGTGVTFYVTSSNFSMKFNGGGNLTASAPTSGEYKGVLLYLAPQVDGNGNLLNTQALDMRGNGSGNIVGSVIAPSADVTMFGNSGTAAFNSQVIGYQIDSGGNANIYLNYQINDNWIVNLPPQVGLIQ
jgi:hypothetical protein